MEDAYLAPRLIAAREQIALATVHLATALGARAPGAATDTLDDASNNLVTASASMAEIAGQLEAAPRMTACPRCGKEGRAAATLCGFCWTKRNAS